jgi:hypothetical protein
MSLNIMSRIRIRMCYKQVRLSFWMNNYGAMYKVIFVTRLEICFNCKDLALLWIRHVRVALTPRQQFAKLS